MTSIISICIRHSTCCVECKECKNGYCECKYSSKIQINEFQKESANKLHISFSTNASNSSDNNVSKPYTLRIISNPKGFIHQIICDNNCYLYQMGDNDKPLSTRNTKCCFDDQVLLISSENCDDPSDPKSIVYCMWLQTVRMVIYLYESRINHRV